MDSYVDVTVSGHSNSFWEYRGKDKLYLVFGRIFWLCIIENSSLNSKKFVTLNMKWNLGILRVDATSQGWHQRTRCFPCFTLCFLAFVLMVMWRLCTSEQLFLGKREGRWYVHMMRVNFLRDLYIIGQHCVLWLPLAAREFGEQTILTWHNTTQTAVSEDFIFVISSGLRFWFYDLMSSSCHFICTFDKYLLNA